MSLADKITLGTAIATLVSALATIAIAWVTKGLYKVTKGLSKQTDIALKLTEESLEVTKQQSKQTDSAIELTRESLEVTKQQGTANLRKAEKSTRFSVVKDIEAATREVFNALADVRTEVYRCVRNIAEIEKNKGREESRREPIPLEIKAACMKFDYACDLLYLRKIDFTDTKHDEKYPSTADFTACVMFLVWLSCRLQLDNGQLTVSMGDTKDFKQFFESDFVDEKGGSPYHIQNPRTLEMVRKWFYTELDKSLVPHAHADITEIDPLYILVITVLMDRFRDLLVSSFELMVNELEIGFADLFKY